MKIFHSIFLLAGFTLMFFTSCDLINPDEDLPVYLEISKPKVRIHPDQNFLADVNVKDVWIYRNEEFLGIFPVPSTIPVFPGDRNNLSISGGIALSGFSGFRSTYPFWRTVQVDLLATPIDTVPIQPIFEYFSPDTNLVFAFEETFDGGSLRLKNNISTLSNSVGIATSGIDPFEKNAGLARFNASSNLMELTSTTSFLLPQRGNNRIFIEVTYKNDIDFTVGMFHDGVNFSEVAGNVFFNAKSDWNTIYIDVNDEVRSIPETVRFTLFIRADGQGETGEILFDNIRIVHFR